VRNNTLSAHQRSAIVTRELLEIGSISSARVRELTGVTSRRGACGILGHISVVIPLWFDEKERIWYLMD
jgi:hypothetical protein